MSYLHALVVSIWLINIHVSIECLAKEWLLMSQSPVELQFITLPSKQYLAFNFDILFDSKYLTHPNKKYYHSFSISISWVLDIQLNTIPSLLMYDFTYISNHNNIILPYFRTHQYLTVKTLSERP
jgi:hypothetical protein